MLLGPVALEFGEAALIPELHGQADDGVALFLKNRCNCGRVNAAGHGNGDCMAALRFFAWWGAAVGIRWRCSC